MSARAQVRSGKKFREGPGGTVERNAGSQKLSLQESWKAQKSQVGSGENFRGVSGQKGGLGGSYITFQEPS